MKLTEKQTKVVDYLKANGGRVSMTELCAALGDDAVRKSLRSMSSLPTLVRTSCPTLSN